MKSKQFLKETLEDSRGHRTVDSVIPLIVLYGQLCRKEEREKIKNELISADLMSEEDAQFFMEGLE